MATSCERGGGPVVLAERRRWLRRLAANELRDPVDFWAALLKLRRVTSGVPHDALRSMMPDPKLPYRVVRRVAGVGSLGGRVSSRSPNGAAGWWLAKRKLPCPRRWYGRAAARPARPTRRGS